MTMCKAAFQLVYIVFHACSKLNLMFVLGELDPQFANVSNNSPIPTYPEVNPYRWSILVDAVIVNNSAMVPTSSIAGAPSNKAVAMIDSGSSYSYVFSVVF